MAPNQNWGTIGRSPQLLCHNTRGLQCRQRAQLTNSGSRGSSKYRCSGRGALKGCNRKHWTGLPNKSILTKQAEIVQKMFENCVLSPSGQKLSENVRKLCSQPLRTEITKKCLKIVFSAPPDNFWTFFAHFFDFSDILSTIPFSGLSNDLLVTTEGGWMTYVYL